MSEPMDTSGDAPGKPSPEQVLADELAAIMKQLAKAASSREVRHTSRALRMTVPLRKKLTSDALGAHLAQQPSFPGQRSLLALFPASSAKEATSSGELSQLAIVYLRLLASIHLIDQRKYSEAVIVADSLLDYLRSLHDRGRDVNLLAARVYFYYSRAHELSGKFADARPKLLAAHRTAALHHDYEGQVSALNLLLRNYLVANLYEQADMLVSKTTSVRDGLSLVSNNQLARFLYYQGRIKAVQLEYTAARECFEEALRKAPHRAARGFRLIVNKMLVLVQLLIGDIPERSLFRQADLKHQLTPYYELTRTVRVGDLGAFHVVVKEHGAVFRADKTLSLIHRLRHNVIKTGLRKINVAYSRIDFMDVCEKLSLDGEEDAEYIVAKAIRDGVIDAHINHEESYLQSKAVSDTYSTYEPYQAFHKRIQFCLGIHNQAVRAMRYPDAFAPEEKDEPEMESLPEPGSVPNLEPSDTESPGPQRPE